MSPRLANGSNWRVRLEDFAEEMTQGVRVAGDPTNACDLVATDLHPI